MKKIKIYLMIFLILSFFSTKSYAYAEDFSIFFESEKHIQDDKNKTDIFTSDNSQNKDNLDIYYNETSSKEYKDKKIAIGLKFSSNAQKQVKFISNGLYLVSPKEDFIFISKSKTYIARPIEKIYVDTKSYFTSNLSMSKEFKEIDDSALFIEDISKGFKKVSMNNIYKDELKNVIGIYDENDSLILVLNSQSDFYFVANENRDYKVFEVFDKKYRGGIKFINKDNLLSVINFVDIEDYLLGVVPKEMWASWNIEALKAQAVASRSFAYSNYKKFEKYGFNLTDDTKSQAYGGILAENKNTTKAVNDTKGIVGYYDGKIAELIYNASSGGKTESAENIWKSKIPYLIAQDDPYSIGNIHDKWSVSFDKTEIENILKKLKKDIGILENIKVDEVSSQGYVLKISFIGSEKTQTLKKDDIRFSFGGGKIKSLRFSINKKDDIYTFTGSGYGHGVGMSQYGAKSMAEKGYTYKDILAFYYPKVLLEKIH